MIDYTQQLKDKAATQELNLESKQDLAIKRMKQKIENIAKSQNLNKYSTTKDKKDFER